MKGTADDGLQRPLNSIDWHHGVNTLSCMKKRSDSVKIALCPSCDLAVERVALESMQEARCPRCGQPLYHNKRVKPQHLMAIALAGLILWFPANLMPMMEVDLLGQANTTTIIEGAMNIIDAEMYFMGALVLFTGSIAPLLTLSLIGGIGFLLSVDFWPQCSRRLIKIYGQIQEWSMVEIYLISFFVAIFKLKDLAELEPGVGLACYISLFTVTLYAAAKFHTQDIWEQLDRARFATR